MRRRLLDVNLSDNGRGRRCCKGLKCKIKITSRDNICCSRWVYFGTESVYCS